MKTMKTITSDRILKAAENAKVYFLNRYGVHTQLVKASARLGLEVVIQDAFPDEERIKTELKRMDLEFDFIGIPKTRTELINKIQEWQAGIDKLYERYDRIKALQLKHNIPSLTIETIEFCGRQIECPIEIESPGFQMTEDDMNLVRSYKTKLFEAWYEVAIANNMKLFKYCKDGKSDYPFTPVEMGEILAHLSIAEWAILNDEESDDGKMAIHLMLGNGSDRTSIESDRVWYCAV